MKLTDAVIAYKLACQAKNISPRTWRWYEQKLRAFTEWAEQNNVTRVPGIKAHHVQAFTVEAMGTLNRYGKPLSDYTVHGHVQVVKGFLSWASGEDLIDEKVVRKITLPRREVKLIQVLTPEHVTLLYTACDGAREKWVTERDRAVLSVMLDTGIRASEVCSLTRQACFLDAQPPYLLINGKGRKQREVGIGKKAAYRLHIFITRYRPKVEHPYIFTSFKERPLTPKGLDDLLYRLRDRAGAHHFANVRISAHTLRHTYAYNFIKQGGDVLRLSRLLGHSSVSVTENYIRCFGARDARGGLSVFDELIMQRA